MSDVIQQMINGLGDIAAKMLKKESNNKIEMLSEKEHAADDLYKELFILIENGKICEAEDKLFRVIETDYTMSFFDVAIQFYAKLDELDEETLKAANFSKAEIEDGLNALKKIQSKILI